MKVNTGIEMIVESYKTLKELSKQLLVLFRFVKIKFLCDVCIHFKLIFIFSLTAWLIGCRSVSRLFRVTDRIDYFPLSVFLVECCKFHACWFWFLQFCAYFRDSFFLFPGSDLQHEAGQGTYNNLQFLCDIEGLTSASDTVSLADQFVPVGIVTSSGKLQPAHDIANLQHNVSSDISRLIQVHDSSDSEKLVSEAQAFEVGVFQMQESTESTTKRVSGLQASEVTAAKNSKGELVCRFCPATFASINGLKGHINKIHFNVTPFVCNICGKGFNFKNHYVGHMNTHNNLKVFKCDLCPCQFSYKASLKRHMQFKHLQ